MRILFAGIAVLLGVGLISLNMYLTAFWKFTSDASFGFGMAGVVVTVVGCVLILVAE